MRSVLVSATAPSSTRDRSHSTCATITTTNTKTTSMATRRSPRQRFASRAKTTDQGLLALVDFTGPCGTWRPTAALADSQRLQPGRRQWARPACLRSANLHDRNAHQVQSRAAQNNAAPQRGARRPVPLWVSRSRAQRSSSSFGLLPHQEQTFGPSALVTRCSVDLFPFFARRFAAEPAAHFGADGGVRWDRRYVAGGEPNSRLKARPNAASDS